VGLCVGWVVSARHRGRPSHRYACATRLSWCATDVASGGVPGLSPGGAPAGPSVNASHPTGVFNRDESSNKAPPYVDIAEHPLRERRCALAVLPGCTRGLIEPGKDTRRCRPDWRHRRVFTRWLGAMSIARDHLSMCRQWRNSEVAKGVLRDGDRWQCPACQRVRSDCRPANVAQVKN
jgi:hypothetical protein